MFRDCPGFCLFAFTVQHTHTSMPPCTLFVLHPYLFQCVDCPAFCLLSLLTTHNTNIHAPCGIRTRNPSRQAATDPRLRPLGHWDLQLSYPGSQTMTMSQSLLHNLCRGSSVVKWLSKSRILNAPAFKLSCLLLPKRTHGHVLRVDTLRTGLRACSVCGELKKSLACCG